MIRLEQVSKSFESKKGVINAVNDVNLHVKKGEIHGVIGYSGAGKSTLIRCVNLLERPTTGKVFIGDKEATSLPLEQLRETRKRIGMIFQGFNLLKTATVYDNIAIPLKLLGFSKSETTLRVEKYLTIVGLADKHQSYPNQLSGGQKQRVAIARALAQEPEILLSDEATSALDPETTDSILDLLLKINQDLGITILLITHEMHVIQKVCDQVYVMEDGYIVEQGSTIDLFTKPQNETTMKFLNTIAQRKLSPSLIKQLNLSGTVTRLTFVGETTGEPILAQVSQKFKVKPNILTANIFELKNDIVGNLVIHLLGEPSEVEAAVSFMLDQGVGLEGLEG
ncbi:ATP-binding cassette domain-containing protein [Virgibacillus sp. C22-A2]|uniref:ATP-binding cassette domain-containing protein n=1 Tax=Virgibacillus tibetensis TaxID=3042313 RepID=A0ABU6KEU6_9BACI|nr:ATP-binding cassette domain-containing protein [Virgibacillus sp. C22-A2]